MQIQKPSTTTLIISHINYSPSGDVVMIWCNIQHSASEAKQYEFKSGQFMLLATEIDGKMIKRSYSIATTPKLLQQQGIIGFSIKRVEGGVFSTRATKVARSGDMLTMTGPLGKMIDHEDCNHYLLISAGSGLSPIYSIYHSLISSGRYVRIANIFGERRFDHVLPCVHHDWVTNVGGCSLGIGSHCEPTPMLSGSDGNNASYVYSQCFLSQDEYEGYTVGRVQLGLANALDRLTTTNIRVFLCGAPGMVDDVRNTLCTQYHIDPHHIHFEKY